MSGGGRRGGHRARAGPEFTRPPSGSRGLLGMAARVGVACWLFRLAGREPRVLSSRGLEPQQTISRGRRHPRRPNWSSRTMESVDFAATVGQVMAQMAQAIQDGRNSRRSAFGHLSRVGVPGSRFRLRG